MSSNSSVVGTSKVEKDKLNNDLKSFSFENKEYFYINQCILNLEEFLTFYLETFLKNQEFILFDF